MSGRGAIDFVWLQQQFPDLSSLVALTPGGQKEVFAAAHATDGAVVLKIVRPQHDLETTRREVVAAQQLAGARVPAILATGSLATQVGTCLWIRERRVDGQTLSELLKTTTLSPIEVLRLGRHLLETLAEAERVHIVHRDVNPRNIIREVNGTFWLIDFGLARHLDLTSLTATAHFLGKFSPGYAPPEQYRNVKGDIDHRCDLFAVGVTLYEASTGLNPFLTGARDFTEVFRRVETQPLPRLLLPIADQTSFADLVAAMTQQKRGHRPSSVADAFDWLKRVCDKEGI